MYFSSNSVYKCIITLMNQGLTITVTMHPVLSARSQPLELSAGEADILMMSLHVE